MVTFCSYFNCRTNTFLVTYGMYERPEQLENLKCHLLRSGKVRESNFGGGDRNQDLDLAILGFVLLELQPAMSLGQM